MITNLVQPHGGKLLPLLIDGEERDEALSIANTLRQVSLNSREVSDLIMLGMGALSPLKGFMNREDYQSVLADMRLTSGLLWPIPINLATSMELAQDIKEGQDIALVDRESNDIIGSMTVETKYFYDHHDEALQVFRTVDRNHPGVASVFNQGDVYLGGPVRVFSEAGYPERFDEFARPSETRTLFSAQGWTTIAAFQTRNPLHRSHEYLTKVALEVCDGLLIHPVVGRLKAGDIPAEVRMECYRTLMENYYPKNRAILKVYPMEMRYGGPKEAILHAIIRQNFGCSHIIIGRDHAGVGDYYGPYDAQNIFDELRENDLYIRPLKLETTFYCWKCNSMASYKTCPHNDESHLLISGTKLREMLSRGERPSEQFSRPEVVDILIRYYQEGKSR